VARVGQNGNFDIDDEEFEVVYQADEDEQAILSFDEAKRRQDSSNVLA